MKIIINPETAAVEEADDLRSFEVILRGGASARHVDRLSCGVLDAGQAHIFIEPSWVQANAGELSRNPDWCAAFTAMVAFAESKGWVDEAGRIRGHIIREAA